MRNIYVGLTKIAHPAFYGNTSFCSQSINKPLTSLGLAGCCSSCSPAPPCYSAAYAAPAQQGVCEALAGDSFSWASLFGADVL